VPQARCSVSTSCSSSEAKDLWISKAVAGRPKDTEFCRALLRTRIVDRETLLVRLAGLDDLDPQVREAVEGRIGAA